MHPPSGAADDDGDAAAASHSTPPATAAQGASAAKRRHRVDSNPLASWGPLASSTPDPKRPRPEAMMSAKAMGKRPATDAAMVDLTRPDPGFHHHRHHHQQLPLNHRPPAGFQPHAGPRKLVVKNLRAAPRPSDPAVQDYYRRARDDLEAALAEVFRERRPRLPLDRLYRAVEDICRNGEAAKLYDMLRERCEAYLHDVVLPKITAEGAASSLRMLSTVHRYWEEWSAQSTTVRSIFSYLDRTFLLKNNKEYMVLNDLFINLFRRTVFPKSKAPMFPKSKAPESSPPGTKVLDGMCQLVQLDRTEDKGFDPKLLQESVNMMHVFNLYGKLFERRLLEESEKYFLEFSEERSEGCSLKDYIGAARDLLQREGDRCNIYNLDSTTKKQIIDVIHRIVVRDHASKLLSDEDVGRLIDECEVESLHALYELLQMTGLHSRLQGPWDRYISTQGSGIVNDVAHTDDMVVRLLVLRRKLDVVVRDAFVGDEEFTYSMREAFRRVINAKPTWATATTSRVGEMVAKYTDMLLRGGLKALPAALISDHKDRAVAERTGVSTSGDEDGELSRQLDKALELFRLIEGKDVFEAFYKRDLARRLLLERSASQDAERDMLAKLHDECGSTFTHNLEQMFKDQALGKEELSAYKQWRDGSKTSLAKIDLDISVLSSAAWPSYPDEPTVTLPPGVAQNLAHFESYYKGKHEGRRLTWKHSLSHCVIRATFPRGLKELVMSAHQAAVLVLFNNVGLDEPLTYGEVEQASRLTGNLLDRTLQSLACGKVRVLVKAPKGRDVAKTDTFTVNKLFADPKIRVKINQIQLKETKQENKETHERVVADRQFETQAAIVRIMKSRKTMPHAQLVAEVIEQTRRRGAMDPVDIKVNIEKLIEKDYIEREGNSYTYLA
ncbi:hypothetical protein RB601_006469 [Gaeumannomyces tritici]